MLLFSFKQEPIFVSCPLETNQNVASVETLAVEGDFDFVFFPEFRLVMSFIPDFYCPSAILPFGNCTFKTAVFKRVVFNFYCQVLLVTFRDSFWNSPTF